MAKSMFIEMLLLCRGVVFLSLFFLKKKKKPKLKKPCVFRHEAKKRNVPLMAGNYCFKGFI